MLQNTAWFVHALNDEVDQLAQQMQQATRGSVREKHGVVGKSYPFNLIAQTRMADAVRDDNTTYTDPTQTKRRCTLIDKALAAIINDFNKVKTVADIDSAILQSMAAAKNREKDIITITAALGSSVTVNEAAETVGAAALPGGQTIAVGTTGLTMSKVIAAAELMNAASVPQEDRYFFYSARAMSGMLNNTAVTSSDFSTLQALMRGGFPMDASWMGFHWRMVTGYADAANTIPILPKSGAVRTCVAWQKQGVGVAYGTDPEIRVNEAPHKWNNTQVVMKLSMGAVRIQDSYVVAVNIDETAAI